MNIKKVKDLILLKLKFASTGAIATAIEYIIYAVLHYWLGFALKTSHFISYAIAMTINFLLHKQYVFQLKRSTNQAFILSILISLGGMALNFLIYSSLLEIELFRKIHWIPKIVATAIVFFYNFYLKRYAFEKKFI